MQQHLKPQHCNASMPSKPLAAALSTTSTSKKSPGSINHDHGTQRNVRHNADDKTHDHMPSAHKGTGSAQPSSTFDPNSIWAKITGKVTQPTATAEETLLEQPKYYLPPKRPEHVGKLTVVLDMDETLVHSEFASELYRSHRSRYQRYRQYFLSRFQQSQDVEATKRARKTTRVYRFTDDNRPYDIALDMEFDDAHARELVFVHTRPHVEKFLETLQHRGYEVVIFTAALPDYANGVLDAIDATHAIHYRLYRQHTRPYGAVAYVKDLSVLGRDLQRTVIVDNNSLAFLAHYTNGIPIADYYGCCAVHQHGKEDVQGSDHERQRDDTELLHILNLLKVLQQQPDVRPCLHAIFNNYELLKSYLPPDAVQQHEQQITRQSKL